MDFDIDVTLGSLADLHRLLTEHPRLQDEAAIRDAIESVQRTGAFDPFCGYIRPGGFDIEGVVYRETVVSHGTNSRGRAVLLALSDLVVERGTAIDVYAPESVTPFAARLRKIYADRFIGSEYLPSPAVRERFPQVRHEDVQSLTFATASLDLYVSCEVLEHVPELDRALCEARRILRPGGCFLGTVPFAYGNELSVVRARIRDGAIEHLLPPEYHGNPVIPSKGSLVYEIPAWDLLDRCRAAGFRDAVIRFIASSRYAVFGTEIAGTFVFFARA